MIADTFTQRGVLGGDRRSGLKRESGGKSAMCVFSQVVRGCQGNRDGDSLQYNMSIVNYRVSRRRRHVILG